MSSFRFERDEDTVGVEEVCSVEEDCSCAKVCVLRAQLAISLAGGYAANPRYKYPPNLESNSWKIAEQAHEIASALERMADGDFEPPPSRVEKYIPLDDDEA